MSIESLFLLSLTTGPSTNGTGQARIHFSFIWNETGQDSVPMLPSNLHVPCPPRRAASAKPQILPRSVSTEGYRFAKLIFYFGYASAEPQILFSSATPHFLDSVLCPAPEQDSCGTSILPQPYINSGSPHDTRKFISPGQSSRTFTLKYAL